MSRVLPPAAAEIGRLLVEEAGGYLRNVVRESNVTCLVCSAPIAPSETYCSQCRRFVGVPGAADRVAAVIYAPYRTQAYRLMSGYKGAATGASQLSTMKLLMGLALRGHIECVMKLGGGGTVRWATVPSLGGRDGEHPLHAIVKSLTVRPDMEVTIAAGDSGGSARDFRPQNFRVDGALEGHVLLIEDSWVSGGHAQSAAGALKAAGASEVSILVGARVLSPEWPDNVEFLKTRLKDDFDPDICPWTGGACP